MKRDHRTEHPGCRQVFPWLRGCSLYKSTRRLLELALADVEFMKRDDLRWFNELIRISRQFPTISRQRSDPRAKYIRELDGWTEDEDEHIVFMTDWAIENGLDKVIFGNRNREEQINYQKYRNRQAAAFDMAYAYGMIHRKTGELRFDKLDKFK